MVFAGDRGYPYAQPNVACLFERSTGDISSQRLEINPHVKGLLGYPVSYQLKPGTNAVPLLDPDDYHLWVTPFMPDERYAAGIYPNQSSGGAGLPEWTRANRRIEDTDLVLWYTLGFHHVVRAEDWPVCLFPHMGSNCGLLISFRRIRHWIFPQNKIFFVISCLREAFV